MFLASVRLLGSRQGRGLSLRHGGFGGDGHSRHFSGGIGGVICPTAGKKQRQQRRRAEHLNRRFHNFPPKCLFQREYSHCVSFHTRIFRSKNETF